MKTVLLLLILLSLQSFGRTFKLYLSADRTGAKESGLSIEQGIRVALDEVNSVINGDTLELEVLDHRGSTPRFGKHCEQFLNDSTAIAMFGGLHSPPILAKRDFINENGIPFFVPWAAAGPITRYPDSHNWIFRLSIDDSKAGEVIAEYAIKEGFKNPALLLEETGWGKSNKKTMEKYLSQKGITNISTNWFNWNLGFNQAKMMLRDIKATGADVIFLVGNAKEGKVIAEAMALLPKEERVPIRSHWGITGGDFPDVINPALREHLDLLFIQSKFSFCPMPEDSLSEEVLKRLKKLYPKQIKTGCDIKAPTGFFHAYDLTKLVIEGMKSIQPLDGIRANRAQLRFEMEQLNTGIQGLIKEYNTPFTQWSTSNMDAHEALQKSDWGMARYRKDNTIELLEE